MEYIQGPFASTLMGTAFFQKHFPLMERRRAIGAFSPSKPSSRSQLPFFRAIFLDSAREFNPNPMGRRSTDEEQGTSTNGTHTALPHNLPLF
jgi:hypothetical protein